jgi:acyl dehydratase
MAIDYPAIIGRQLSSDVCSYSQRDTMLYALSLGLGTEPLDSAQLKFVYESHLVTLPTLACVVGYRSIKELALGIDYAKVVHSDQSLIVHRALPSSGTILSTAMVEDVIDRGADKGALLMLRRTLVDQSNGELLAESRMGILCRGDGGFSASPGSVPAAHALPDCAPDASFDQVTSTQAALLYRLNGDLNPLHADPEVARRVGFDKPILHGLATFGMAVRAVLATMCGYEAARIRAVAGRFSSPVYPGDTLRTEMWRVDDIVSFRCRAVERGVVVFNNGRIDLR